MMTRLDVQYTITKPRTDTSGPQHSSGLQRFQSDAAFMDWLRTQVNVEQTCVTIVEINYC